jgi:mannose-6-phosphate isomerase
VPAVGRVQRARIDIVRKPWGSRSLLPWSSVIVRGEPVGELWYEPADANAEAPALLLKLLFTEQRLSVQVHPDDDFAQSIGLPNGKSEAWYVLSARRGAQVAIGLKSALTPPELRAAVLDGSVAKLIGWRDVRAGEVIYVPAGTIHAIGPGLVIAEIQQRSDATFRMFDYGRDRELHLDNAIAVADANPPAPQTPASKLSEARTVLVANEFFILERLTLLPASSQRLTASGETWIMAISGRLALGGVDLDIGEVALMSAHRAELTSGSAGAIALVAYPGPDVAAGLIEAATQLEVPA